MNFTRSLKQKIGSQINSFEKPQPSKHKALKKKSGFQPQGCLLYTSPSPRD